MLSLLTVKNFIVQRKVVTLDALLQTFPDNREKILAYLEILKHKGKIERCITKPACFKRCTKCPAISENHIEYRAVLNELI